MGTCMQRYFSFLHRKLAEAGAHVVMAVRNTKAANELIKKWQEDWAGKGLPLNIEVYNMNLRLHTGGRLSIVLNEMFH